MQYRRDDGWNPLPHFNDVTGIACDGNHRVLVLNRTGTPLTIVAGGQVVGEMLRGACTNPHGLTIAPDGCLHVVDNIDHTVRVFSADGRLLQQIGALGQASDTGYEPWYGTVKRAAGPFNMPTNSAFARDGSFYVTDGYGNARVHHFAGDGTLMNSWGTPGDGPGQFNLPHGVVVDDLDRVLVADRENSRIQVFSAEGRFIEAWTHVNRPCNVAKDGAGRVYVAELGFHTGLPPETDYDVTSPRPCVSVLSMTGERLAQIGGDGTDSPDLFFAPHDICVGGDGAIYVAEIPLSASVDWGPKPGEDRAALHRFVPVD